MEFLIYATLFRLSVIGAGVIFMYFGYRLFLLGVMPAEGAEIGTQAGEVKLTVKNAAPGTCFSLFGMILIGLMIWQSSPELKITEQLENSVTRETVMRGTSAGSDTDDFDLIAALKARKPTATEIAQYAANNLSDPQQSLDAASAHMMWLSSAFLRDQRPDQAASLVRLIYQFSGDKPDVLALMAKIEQARGETALAQAISDKLVSLYPEESDLIDVVKQDLFK